MKILAADDEPLALEMLVDVLHTAVPDAEIVSFLKPSKLVEYLADHTCDVAFLDIHMRGTTGLVLAQKIKDEQPETNIIFVTGYEEFTGEAMSMHASGYILKPVTVEKVQAELNDLRYPLPAKNSKLLMVKCFGNFDVFDPNGKPIHFDRSRSKEVLAYLIYRAGASCTTKEIAAILFEDEAYDKNQRGYVQKIVASMMHSLREVGAEEVILKNFNSLSIDPSRIDCDYYRFAKNDPDAIESYLGEFMSQFTWAEYVTGYLEEQFWKKDAKQS